MTILFITFLVVVWFLTFVFVYNDISGLALIRSFSIGYTYEKAESRPAPLKYQGLKLLCILCYITTAILFTTWHPFFGLGVIILSVLLNKLFKHVLTSWILGVFNKLELTEAVNNPESRKETRPKPLLFYKVQTGLVGLIDKLIKKA